MLFYNGLTNDIDRGFKQEIMELALGQKTMEWRTDNTANCQLL